MKLSHFLGYSIGVLSVALLSLFLLSLDARAP